MALSRQAWWRRKRVAGGMLSLGCVFAAWLGWLSPPRDWRRATGWSEIPGRERPVSADPWGGHASHDERPEIRWLGHAGFLIRWAGRTILLDPNTSRNCSVSRRVLDGPADLTGLGFVDAALISHAHFDHLDLPTLRSLPDLGTVVVPRGSEVYVDGEIGGGVAVVGLDAGEPIRFGDLEAVAVPALHNGNRFHPLRSRRLAVGYVLRWRGTVVYFAGDTGYGGHFAAIRDTYHPDLAILPIGAYAPRWPLKHYHLSPEEAVRAARDLGVETVIPSHFGTFTLSLDLPSWALPRFAAAAHHEGVRWVMPALLGESP